MLGRLWAVVLVVGVIVLVGYVDSTSTHEIEDARITVRTIDAPWLAIDTQPLMEPYTEDQLFFEVHWLQPNGERIANIQLSGKLMDNDKVVANFNAPCLRKDGAWLADISVFASPTTGIPYYVCYVKLDAKLPRDGTPPARDLRSSWVRLERLQQMQLKDFASKVRAVSTPMRYVVWINDCITKIRAMIAYPFDRSA